MPNNQTYPKILYLITQSELGGAQTYVLDLAFSLKNQGYSIVIAAGENPHGYLFECSKKIGLTAYHLPYLQRKINLYHDIKAFFSLIKLLKLTKPNIIHLNSSKAGFLGSLAAAYYNALNLFKEKNIKIKIIYTVHGLVLNEPLILPKKIFYWLAEWFSAKFKNYLICVSEYDKKSVLNFKIAPLNKIVTIKNGIDLPNIKFLTHNEALGKINQIIGLPAEQQQTQNFLIGTIANLYPTKGLIYLVEAAREIKQFKDNVRFVIIGEGQERKKLENVIVSYGLKKTVFLIGAIENATRYLKAFDLLVLPSIKEGLPYVLIEAQAAGLPVIATAVGGNPEIIEHNKNGLLVQAKNFPVLAENIINLLCHQEKMNQFSSAAIENSHSFSLSTMVEKTKNIYFGR